MATCTITYSADIAHRAARMFFWRRFKTPLGVSFLMSLPAMAGAMWLVYTVDGANWFIGVTGVVLFLNLIIQSSYYFTLPKAFALRLSDPTLRNAEIETSPQGVRVVSGPHANLLTWERFKYIWIYDDFVILAVKPPFMPFIFLPTRGMTPEVLRDIRASRVV